VTTTKSNYLYLGTAGAVVKVSKDKGEIQWRSVLKTSTFFGSGHHFVSVLAEDDRVFVHTLGELFCLDPANGKILWRNPLSGLGDQLGTLATEQARLTPDQVQADDDRNRS
jgi:outer membrane protein assembly factor BamB